MISLCAQRNAVRLEVSKSAVNLRDLRNLREKITGVHNKSTKGWMYTVEITKPLLITTYHSPLT